ncbi:MAG: threonine/serine exporter family protein, partial [Streptomyces sp.]|nr:threonine/serine exporter family protein [Streptomyces sp.]
MTEAEHRKPQSDEARSFYDSEITSEFAVPDGLAMPRTVGGEPETTSEFALPKGLDVPQPSAAEPEGSAFTAPRTYSAKDAPPAFTPPTGIPVVSLTKDVPWQDRMRTMLRMPVA